MIITLFLTIAFKSEKEHLLMLFQFGRAVDIKCGSWLLVNKLDLI